MNATREDGRRTIGDVARACGVPAHVLRHWENEGLLHPGRDAAGNRQYGAEDLHRIAIIVLGKQMELGLDRMRHVLAADPERRRALLEAHHAAVDERIAALRTAQELTRRVLDHGAAGDAEACARFEEVIVETVRERACTLP
ncbi:MerR family transcriptional regulator [Pseudonocardia sp. MH-G8]|uniref:MerR family transcriptional regulator n=1 Tax=Pseudonocardia sp. MH-G8 TaxID=1854588 RepID=UPI00117BBB19|nr:MerR family transcriptional regulator [Pseudonocardia sp. MH-G8]